MAASAAARKQLQHHREFVAAFDRFVVAAGPAGTELDRNIARRNLTEARNRLGGTGDLDEAVGRSVAPVGGRRILGRR